VSELKRIRSQQRLREAEGYLELIRACEGTVTLAVDARNRLAQRALDVMSDMHRSRSNQAVVFYLMGIAFREMERHHEAIKHFESAAEIDGENIHVWLALGWCHKRTGRLDLAIQSLEEALGIDPERAIIYYNLACYWSLANNVKLALDYLARSFEIDDSFRHQVGDEADFDPIRSDPRFLELTSVIV